MNKPSLNKLQCEHCSIAAEILAVNHRKYQTWYLHKVSHRPPANGVMFMAPLKNVHSAPWCSEMDDFPLVMPGERETEQRQSFDWMRILLSVSHHMTNSSGWGSAAQAVPTELREWKSPCTSIYTQWFLMDYCRKWKKQLFFSDRDWSIFIYFCLFCFFFLRF